MDEATSALDPISTAKIEDLVGELKSKYTVIMVTHNMLQALRVSDKTAFFLLGEMVEAGSTDDIFTNPADPRTPTTWREGSARPERCHPERSAEGAEPKDPVRRQLGVPAGACGILSALRKFDVAASPWFFLLLYNRFDGGESALPAERTNP